MSCPCVPSSFTVNEFAILYSGLGNVPFAFFSIAPVGLFSTSVLALVYLVLSKYFKIN